MNAPDQSFFTLFGSKENATNGEIKQAYHKLALKYHPDHAPAQIQKQHHEIMQILNHAYDALKGVDTRNQGDRKHAQPPSRGNTHPQKKLQAQHNHSDTPQSDSQRPSAGQRPNAYTSGYVSSPSSDQGDASTSAPGQQPTPGQQPKPGRKPKPHAFRSSWTDYKSRGFNAGGDQSNTSSSTKTSSSDHRTAHTTYRGPLAPFDLAETPYPTPRLPYIRSYDPSSGLEHAYSGLLKALDSNFEAPLHPAFLQLFPCVRSALKTTQNVTEFIKDIAVWAEDLCDGLYHEYTDTFREDTQRPMAYMLQEWKYYILRCTDAENWMSYIDTSLKYEEALAERCFAVMEGEQHLRRLYTKPRKLSSKRAEHGPRTTW